MLDHDLTKDLIDDARKFLESGKWYADLGIPYRRGYLLYGPPGCGKTSFCQVLAGALRLDVCILTLSNKGMDDNGLAALLRDAPSHSVVILEDVDAVFAQRELQRSAGDGASGITFSGLLNAIDGVASQEGRLFMMTTNHIERLDPALIRPGRCDVKVMVCNASRDQMAAMFLRFFPGRDDDARRFAARLPPGELSMAQIQGHLVEHKDSAEEAIESTLSLLHSARPKIDPPMSVWQHLRRLGLERCARARVRKPLYTGRRPRYGYRCTRGHGTLPLCYIFPLQPSLPLSLSRARAHARAHAHTASGRYATLFERHGYPFKEDLRGLTAAKAAAWSVELKTNLVRAHARARAPARWRAGEGARALVGVRRAEDRPGRPGVSPGISPIKPRLLPCVGCDSVRACVCTCACARVRVPDRRRCAGWSCCWTVPARRCAHARRTTDTRAPSACDKRQALC